MKKITVGFVWLCACVVGWDHILPASFYSGDAGRQYVYAYASEGTGYSDIQRLYNTDSTAKALPFFYRPSVQTTNVKIQCKIRKTIIKNTGDKRRVCFEILQPSVQIENNALPVDANMIIKEMTLPVFADMSDAGNILSIKTDTSISYLTAGIVKNILSNTQAVIIFKEKSWQVIEEDINGMFKADYNLVNKRKDSVEYRKINSGYEQIKSGKKGQKLLPENNTTIVTNASRVVQRINTSESLVTSYGQDTIVVSGSSTSYKLLSEKKTTQRELLGFEQLAGSGKYSKPVALSDPISAEQINKLAYKNTLGGDNFETLMTQLRMMNTMGASYERELMKKFRALAWLSETDCSKMAAVLNDASPASDTFRVMIGALAATETPYSINELAAIVARRKNDERVMAKLLPVLATSPTPTIKAAEVVKELAFSPIANSFITSTAQLTLGGMVKNLAALNKTKADELTNVIIDHLKDSPDTLQQLLVYGNTGAYSLLPVYISYINNPSVSNEIRKAAVFAIRLIEHNEVTPLLEKLVNDKDTIVSKAANETILFRKQYSQGNF